MSREDFEALWLYAVKRDFILESDPSGPLRRALGR
jgi:hypothetical protein